MKKIAQWTLVVLAAVLAAIQLVPVDRSNPPVEAEVSAPAGARAVLRRACYDCHSNETVWPWYSRIAPVSWQIAHDVREGREALNFSMWNRLGPKDRSGAMRAIREEVAEGEMPPRSYLPFHPRAHLSAADRALLDEWTLTAQPARADGD